MSYSSSAFKASVYSEKCAHLAIDVLGKYCNPKRQDGTKDSQKVSQNIDALLPKFRDRGVINFVVFDNRKYKGPFNRASADIYLKNFDPDLDTPLQKEENSAFNGTNLEDMLRDRGIETLFISGFNARFCIKDTVEDAKKLGFEVILIKDGIGENITEIERKISPATEAQRVQQGLDEMSDEGVTAQNADSVFELITSS